MNLPTQAQVVALGRHVVTFAAGATTFAAMTNVISAGDANTIGESIKHITDGVAQIAAGVAPLIAIGSAIWASFSASLKSQITAVNAAPGVKVVAQSAPAATVTAPPK